MDEQGDPKQSRLCIICYVSILQICVGGGGGGWCTLIYHSPPAKPSGFMQFQQRRLYINLLASTK
jgi:hypothetical protein